MEVVDKAGHALLAAVQAVEENRKPEKRVVELERKAEETVQRSGGGRTITVHAASTKMEDSPIHKTSAAFETSNIRVDTRPSFWETSDSRNPSPRLDADGFPDLSRFFKSSQELP